ncbi:adenylate kinase [Planobacterium oryzisoli]|uniref:Adenylate kinase n=1 Tax=Planobacterium oryzisoli TaxID=2771435 RepID=A0A930YWV3_9FLAO|nr:adenylate kinase [Planobacterium oryzisoli]MBF5027769.1 adenylate kinase [Planobacterium oryzisoli]
MVNIVLFGPPGSGKGTQALNLIEKYNLKQISTGDLFRYNMKNNTSLGQLAKSYIDSGKLVPDQVTIDMLVDEVRKPSNANGYIFDGFPRTAAQTQALEEIVDKELNAQIDICLALVVDDEILVDRLVNRGKTSGRTDDSDEAIIRDRIKEYYTKTAEVAELYKQQGKYVEINGVGAIEEITMKLCQEVDKLIKNKT